jgi:hypothetical protein
MLGQMMKAFAHWVNHETFTYIQANKAAVLGVKHKSMNTGSGEFLSLLVRFDATTLHDTGLVHVDALFNHIELDETTVALVSIADRVQFLLVETVPKSTTAVVEQGEAKSRVTHCKHSASKSNLHITNVAQPVLQGSHVVVIVLSSLNTSTLVVTTDNDVRDLQVGNGVLQCRH